MLPNVLLKLRVGMAAMQLINPLVHLLSPVGTVLKKAVILTVHLVVINPQQSLAVRVGMKLPAN